MFQQAIYKFQKLIVPHAIPVVLALLCTDTIFAQTQKISATRYDYSVIAQHITNGCVTKTDQAEAIYRWICKHISYDTEHKIHTADECWDHKKGVCQAYCELFYRLAEPLKLECMMIPGVSKDDDGVISDNGHAWLYIEVEDGGILADPTWGAGGVKEGEFVRSEEPMTWFHVDPHWLIFTHYPNNAVFQFIADTIDAETFAQLPPLKPSLGVYGFSGKEVMQQCIDGDKFTMPHMYSAHCEELYLVDIPLQSTLRPGQHYTFEIAKRTERDMTLIHGSDYIGEEDWATTDSSYILSYMPTEGGQLYIAIQREEGDYSVAVEYEVAEPTDEELDIIEREYPYKMPEMKGIENLHPEKLQAIGISGEEILREVRKGRLSTIFTLYKNADVWVDDIEVPLSQYMQIGNSYQIAVKPAEPGEWAVFLNGKLYDKLTPDESSGWHILELTPSTQGTLSVNMKSTDGKYYRVIEYKVTQ